MATLYVSWVGGLDQGFAKSPLSTDVVTTSGTSANSGANPSGFGAMLFSDTAHYVATGDSPTASAATGMYLPANQWTPLAVRDGALIAAVTV